MKKKTNAAVFITALSIFTLYIINRIIFIAATIKETLFSKNGNYYSWRLGKIFYTKQGKGSPLLLVHNLNSISSDYEWKKVIQQLEKQHTVYTIDLLGCGRSDKPKIIYTGYLYVQLLTDFCKNIIKEPVDIAVTGHACQAVLMACSIENSLFKNIILINPENLADANKSPKYRHKIMQFILNSPIIGTLIYNIGVSKKIIKNEFIYNYFGSHTSFSKKYIEAYYESAHLKGSSSKYLHSSIQCRYTNTPVQRGIESTDNNLVIFGGQTVPKIIKTLEQYTSLNPLAKTTILKGCGLLPQLEFPEYFCQNLEQYIK